MGNVHRRPLGRTGLMVSEVGLGALELGRNWRGWDQTGNQTRPSEEAATHLLNTALDAGCNFIDTAAAYHLSEERIGKAIGHRRGEYILATKCGEWCDENGSLYDYGAEATGRFIDESLRKLRTDHVDLLQIHSASREVVERGETLEAMKTAQQAGKVRFLGLSCGQDAALAAIATGHYDTLQISYNVLDRWAEARVLPLARENNLGVIIKDGLAAGRLLAPPEALPAAQRERYVRAGAGLRAQVGRDPEVPDLAALLLRWVLSNPAVSTVIAGTRDPSHLLANLALADGKGLSPTFRETASAAAAPR